MKIRLVIFFVLSCLFAQAQEDCGNGIDDDGDGLIDCLDPDCGNSSGPNASDFNTGTNGMGGILPGGSNDLNWTIATNNIAGPYVPAIVMSSIPGSYYNSPWPDCYWISHNATGSHSGNVDYYYKLNFFLPCYNTCGQSYADSAIFCLTMDFYVDNSVFEIYINGIPQSPNLGGIIPVANPYGYVGFSSSGVTTVSLCQDWQPGLNEMIVHTKSGGPYEGFLAQYSTSVQTQPGDPTIVPPVLTGNAVCEAASPVTFTGVNPGGTWSAACGSCIDTTTGVFDPSLAGVGTWLISYTVQFPCPATDTALITVLPNANPAINAAGPFCIESGNQVLTAADPGGTWSGTGITNPAAGIFDPVTAGTGTHWVYYSIAGMCGSADSLQIQVNQVTLLGSASDASCYGIADGAVQASAVGTPGYQYTLSGDTSLSNTSGAFPGIYAGTYNITVTDANGCTFTLSNLIVNSPPPLIAAFTASPYSGTPPLNVSVTNSSTGAAGYYWDFGNGDTALTTNAATVYNTNGLYWITLVAFNNGCADTMRVAIQVETPSSLVTYNVFTPNGDGVNDYFTVTYENIRDFEMIIYNRWGQVVYKTLSLQPGWNGKHTNGSDCPEGTYYFMIKASGYDEKIYADHGHVTLLRRK